MALLEVRDLRVAIPVPGGILHPVRSVDFSLERGQTLGIVGESGSGKSLTALALMGLTPARARVQAGALELGGRDLLALDQRELAREVRGSRMAMIFQEPMTSLNPVYTIGRQLTETMLLGVVAMKTGQSKKIYYDGEKGQITNNSDSNQYLQREYRKGWSL